jgi:hypothetical protein
VKYPAKHTLLLQKKISWILLTFFITFDGVVSYWAVKFMHGKEADLLIAPWVEKYPILYFPIIPILCLTMFIIVKMIKNIAVRILKKWRFTDEHMIERIVLTATVIYWAIGNSSGNLIFLLGLRISAIWLVTTLLALPITLAYVVYALFQMRGLANN